MHYWLDQLHLQNLHMETRYYVEADLPPDHMSKESVLVISPVFPIKRLMQPIFSQYLLDMTSQYIH